MRPGAVLRVLLLVGPRLWAGLDAGDWEWKTVRTEENRFVVNGVDPSMTQDVAVWMDQTLRRMGREFGVSMGFDPIHPVVVVLHPEAESVRLLQQGRGRRMQQEIWSPDGDRFDGERFAEVFVEAMLTRFFNQDLDAEPVRVPDWLVRGWAAEFVPGRRGDLRARGVAAWRQGRMNPPYTLTAPGMAGGGVRSEDAVWGVAYLFALAPDPPAVWSEIFRTGGVSVAWWLRVSGAGSLRDLHLAWEVWMADRSRRFLADPAAEDLFLEQIARELVFTPGRFGVTGEDVPQGRRFALPDLADRLDEPWVLPVLNGWMRRMSMLRFGQRAGRLQMMDLYMGAGEALREAAGLRGDRREAALERFRLKYEAAGSF
jgi:hypothetical protein